MLRIIRSCLASIPLDPERWPEAVAEQFRGALTQPERVQWVVPSARRGRIFRRAWLGTGAAFLPAIHTFESFVAEALSCSPQQGPCIGPGERMLRLARAWQDVRGRQAGPGLLRQLECYLRDWQACALDASAQTA